MSSVSLPYPHKKQLEYFLSGTRYNVINAGRRCISKGTLVLTDQGLIPIEELSAGQEVWSYNGQINELKQITKVYKFEVDYIPKPMIQFRYGKEYIKTTFDHPFYNGKDYVPLFKLVWGSLDTSQRQTLKLLCEQYGQDFDYELEEQEQNQSDEASPRCLWVFENGSGRKNNKSPQVGCSNISRKSREQTSGKPQERSEARQPSGELGVGDTQREHRPRYDAQSSSTELRREREWCENNGKTSDKNYTTIKNLHRLRSCSKDCEEDKNNKKHSSRHQAWEDLGISPSEETYCLEVESNHNFFIGKAGLLVHNTGKSVGTGLKTFLSAVEVQGNYFIVAPTYSQAKSIYWNDILKSIIPKDFINATNEKELYIELKPFKYDMKVAEIWGRDINVTHDPNKPYSRIYLKGAENPDSLRGVSLNGVVIDEVSSMEKFTYLWEYVLRPALGDRQGWADFISTPDGVHGAFYKLCLQAQSPEKKDWTYIHATALDNPYFPIEEWAEQRKSYEQDGKLDTFIQEWEAKFATPARLVYREFNRLTHVIQPKDIPFNNITRAISMDFGYADPFAVVFVAIDRDQNIYIYDEIYERYLDTDGEVKELNNKMGNDRFTRILADAQNKGEIKNLRNRGINVVASPKGDIMPGVKLVKTYLNIRESTGKPKLFVSANCQNTIMEFESYSFLDNAWGEIDMNRPNDKEQNHLMDALRYLLMSIDRKNNQAPKAKKRYNASGRIIS